MSYNCPEDQPTAPLLTLPYHDTAPNVLSAQLVASAIHPSKFAVSTFCSTSNNFITLRNQKSPLLLHNLPPYWGITICIHENDRSLWPHCLRRDKGLLVWIPLGTWMSVSSGCSLLSSRSLCVELIIRPEESYRVWCVGVLSWRLDNEEALAD